MSKGRKYNKIELDLNKLLVQHNALVNSHYSMTILEMRLFLFMLYETDSQYDSDFKDIHIPISYFEEASKTNKMTLYQCIEDTCDNLLRKVIKVASLKKGDTYHAISLMSSCRYERGIVTARFNPEVKPYLLKLKDNFTSKTFGEILQFKMFYSHRIFDLLKQYENLSKYRKEPWFERTFPIQNLRELLSCEDKYQKYSDFKRLVLKKVQKELSGSSMAFTFMEKRISNKVVSVTFRVHKQVALQTEADQQGITLGDQEKRRQSRAKDPREQLRKIYEGLPEDERRKENHVIKRLLANDLSAEQTLWVLRNVKDLPQIHKACYQVELKVRDSKIENRPAYLMKIFKEQPQKALQELNF